MHKKKGKMGENGRERKWRKEEKAEGRALTQQAASLSFCKQQIWPRLLI